MDTFSSAIHRHRLFWLAVTASLLLVADWTPDFTDALDVVRLTLCLALGGIALVWSAGELGAKGILRLGAELFLAVTSVVVALLCAEGAVRWVYRDVTTTGDDRGFFSLRWSRGANQENRFGFREREHSTAPAAGVYRVAVIGDSFTFGNGIPEAGRFSNILDKELEPHRIEVLNFGQPGSNTPDHVRLLEKNIFRFQPSFVLLQWFVNDAEGDIVVGRPVYPPLAMNAALHDWLYARSALYTLLNIQWIRHEMAGVMGGTYADYMQRRLGDPEGPDAIAADQTLKAFIDLCKNHDTGVGIVLFPDLSAFQGGVYPFAYLHKRVLDRCEAEDIRCLDLSSILEGVKDTRRLWASPFDAHPSVRANEMAAVEILSIFGPLWGARAGPP